MMLFSAAVLALSVVATGWSAQATGYTCNRFEVRLAENQPAWDLIEASVGESESELRVYLHKDAILTDADVLEINVLDGDTPDTRTVEVIVTAEADATLRKASQTHLGSPLAILIDGKLWNTLRVQSELKTPIRFSGLPRDEAARIAEKLRGI